MNKPVLTQPVLNIFVLGYLAAAIFLLTLSPFDFQAYVPSEFWVFRASVEDVSRNILLFMPFGLLLRHTFLRTFERSHRTALFGGFLLSLSVECAQLFIEARTSNLADLISNSSGALLGSLLYQLLFESNFNSNINSNIDSKLTQQNASRKRSIHTSELPIALMFIPICWINAMRSITDPAAVQFAIPNAIAGILLIQQTYPLSKTYQYIVASCWAILALLPLVNTSPDTAWLFALLTPGIIYASAHLPKHITKRMVIATTLLGFLFVIWYAQTWNILPDKFLYGQGKRAFEIIFRSAEILFLALAISVSALGFSSTKAPATGTSATRASATRSRP